jgi:hypothetical protein
VARLPHAEGADVEVSRSVRRRLELAPKRSSAKLAQAKLIAATFSIAATQFFSSSTIADAATVGDTVRLPALITPMARRRRRGGSRCRGRSRSGIIEVSGPAQFDLPNSSAPHSARGDPRRVVADPAARYWGVELSERTSFRPTTRCPRHT